MADKKLAAITGASAGIGKAIAEQMAKNGYNLILIARRENLLKELASDLEGKYKIKATYLLADLSHGEGYKALAKQMAEHECTYFFNNAGVGYFGDLAEQDVERVDNMVNLLINSVTYLTCEITKQMAKRGGGTIVNVSSIAAFPKYSPGMSVYSAAKKYVYDLSRATQFENQQLGNNVTVVALQPGAIKTEWQQNAMADPKGEFKHPKLYQDANQFAEVVVRRILAGKKVVTYGPMANMRRFLGVLPAKTAAKGMYGVIKKRMIGQTQ